MEIVAKCTCSITIKEKQKSSCCSGDWQCQCRMWSDFQQQSVHNSIFSRFNLLSICMLSVKKALIWLYFAYASDISRLPTRPVINSPVVSVIAHQEGESTSPVLHTPITLMFRLLETQERTKPVCVFWNHSVPWVHAIQSDILDVSHPMPLISLILLVRNLYWYSLFIGHFHTKVKDCFTKAY